jgi:hypothetical protein
MVKKDIFKNVDKDWYKSKTVWIAFTVLVLAVLQTFGIAVPEVIYVVLVSSGLLTSRDASGLKYRK